MKNTRATYITMMLEAGADMGWVAKQVGHTTFKMIYEHYYRYMKKDDPSEEVLEYFAAAGKKNPEKWSQNGHTPQDAVGIKL